MSEVDDLIGSLRASCEQPPADDELDPENALPANLASKRQADAKRARGDDTPDPETSRKNPEALRMMKDDLDDDLDGGMDHGRRRGGSGMGLDSYPRSRGPGSLAKAEAEFRKMVGAV
jgi:hypothetical protein